MRSPERFHLRLRNLCVKKIKKRQITRYKRERRKEKGSPATDNKTITPAQKIKSGEKSWSQATTTLQKEWLQRDGTNNGPHLLELGGNESKPN